MPNIYIGLIYLCAVENHKSINQNSKQKFFLFLFISYQHLINIEGYEFYYCD